MPDDAPRLRTIERYLLMQLAAVRRAIERTENPQAERGTADTSPRWSVQWQRTPIGKPRQGTMHRAECWMATGERLTVAQAAAERRRRDAVITPCTACRPQRPG